MVGEVMVELNGPVVVINVIRVSQSVSREGCVVAIRSNVHVIILSDGKEG